MNVSKSIAPILLAGSTLVAGCSWTGSVFNDKVDYQAARTRTVPLEIPPDLSQLPRDERFTVPERPQSVTASAATAARPGAPAGAPASAVAATVAPTGALAKIERDGSQRWLAVNMKIADGMLVSLDVTMYDAQGELLERSDSPLQYLHGHEDIFPRIEEALVGHDGSRRHRGRV